MNRNKLIKDIRKLNLDNPLEYMRQMVAPLCKEKLNEHILSCNDCKTCKDYNKNLAKGNPNANYLIINDNATDDENINLYLNSILEAAGVSMNDVFIINSISCILKRTFNNETIIRLPNRQETANCRYFVNYAIEFVKPRVIICMGATSLAMFKNNVTMEEMKSKFTEINGIKTIVTHSTKDIFTMSEYYSENEIEDIVNNVVNDVAKAKEYVDSLRRV